MSKIEEKLSAYEQQVEQLVAKNDMPTAVWIMGMPVMPYTGEDASDQVHVRVDDGVWRLSCLVENVYPIGVAVERVLGFPPKLVTSAEARQNARDLISQAMLGEMRRQTVALETLAVEAAK